MFKPRIVKSPKGWLLYWMAEPRSFSLFGADAQERQKIRLSHLQAHLFKSWSAALDYLRHVYARNEIQRFDRSSRLPLSEL